MTGNEGGSSSGTGGASDGAGGSVDTASCEQRRADFDDFVKAHRSCTQNSDCAIVGDCGSNPDFTAVRADSADVASRKMAARCQDVWDGPLFDAVCYQGSCVEAQRSDLWCGRAPGDAGASDHCSGALRVKLGETVEGTTCGAVPVGSSPCQPGNPDALVIAEVPDNLPFVVESTPGVSILGFSRCDDPSPAECVYDRSSFAPTDPYMRLFGIEHVDMPCGKFTVTVRATP